MKHRELTVQEVEDTYHFKLAKKMLMKEYPWISDIIVDRDNLNKYRLVFVDIIINNNKIKSMYKWKEQPWTSYGMKQEGQYVGSSLSVSYQIHQDVGQLINNRIGDIFNLINYTTAIPEELKIPFDRYIALGNYIIIP
jgi:hypothetical protein